MPLLTRTQVLPPSPSIALSNKVQFSDLDFHSSRNKKINHARGFPVLGCILRSLTRRPPTSERRPPIEEHRSAVEIEKGALPLLWNWNGVCFGELTPSWRTVAVKTDSSVGMSLKFISASQGRGRYDQFHSAPDYLAPRQMFALSLALGSPNTRSMPVHMMFLSGRRTSGCPGLSHKSQYTGSQSLLGKSIWTNMRSSPDTTSAPVKGSLYMLRRTSWV